MAGYIFAIGNVADPVAIIKDCVQKGVYSTYVKSTSSIPFEGTLADFISMKPGDNIYFFCKRKFYGIGELVDVGPDCKYCNYIDSSRAITPEYQDIKDELLVDYGINSIHNRWICTFKGSPYFFENGIDTDEILNYKPSTFKMLRAFWKLSFIKIGEEENDSLKEIILLRHQQESITKQGILQSEKSLIHSQMLQKDLDKYKISISTMLLDCTIGDRITHEMALEASVIEALTNNRINELGRWDYISHQVIASPFKPIDYMDKIDVFASRNLSGTRIQSKYLVCELKKDAAGFETVNQVLKYVDWVCNEYAYGDYGAVEACVIAYEYPSDINEYLQKNAKRYYTQGSHPINNKEWSSIRLLKYKYYNGSVIYKDETQKA